jgi:hypothetical protein
MHAGAEGLGAGLPHLFTVQVIARLSSLVYNSHGGPITSLLLRAAIEAALLEAGWGPSPWHPEFKAVLQVITKSFMVEHSIDLHHSTRMDGYSQQDVFIVANFINQGASQPELTLMI